MNRRLVLGLALAAAVGTGAAFRAPHSGPALVPLAAASEPAVPTEPASERPSHRRPRGGHRRSRHPLGHHGRPRHPRKRHGHAKPAPAEPIDLNHADAATLARVTGVGEWLAARIVAYRRLNGPFASIDELAEVDGISDRRVESLARYLVVR